MVAKKDKYKSAFTYNGTATKVDAYKWAQLDSRGQYLELDKHDLVVNHAYQRGEIESKILAIARDWSWPACLAIGVARRVGKHYVFDGQQRVAAARRRADIDALPCMVYDLKGTEEEAQAFIDVNTLRKPITAIEKFNADLFTRDPVALTVQSLVDQSGYVIAKNAKLSENRAELKCVSTLKKWARLAPDVLIRVWPLIVEVAGRRPVHQYHVEAIVYVELALERKGAGESLLKAPWRGRVVALGSHGVLEACKKAISYRMRGGAKTCAEGLVDALNKGVRNRLYLTNAEAEADV